MTNDEPATHHASTSARTPRLQTDRHQSEHDTRVTRQPGLIQLAGDLDREQGEFADLLIRFAESAEVDAHVDLSEVTRFDPAALSFLVALRRICASRSGAVTLVNPSSVVRRALSHGLEPYFHVHEGPPIRNPGHERPQPPSSEMASG